MLRIVFAAILSGFISQGWSKPPAEGERRVAAARQTYQADVRAALERKGLRYPPREIFIRVFKFESILEVWARDRAADAFKFVIEFPLDGERARGRKKREGDFQTPEGFYRIVDFNPESAAYLSMRIDYPNAADRIYAGGQNPGSLIFIHGEGYSTGCVPVVFPGIAQLYLMALDARRRPIQVHIFPHQLDRPDEEVDSDRLTLANPGLEGFWNELRPVYDAFEKTKRLPRITITKDGHYAIARGGK